MSWSMWQRSLISRSVLFASILLSNAFPIFFMATSSLVSEFVALLHHIKKFNRSCIRDLIHITMNHANIWKSQSISNIQLNENQNNKHHYFNSYIIIEHWIFAISFVQTKRIIRITIYHAMWWFEQDTILLEYNII